MANVKTWQSQKVVSFIDVDIAYNRKKGATQKAFWFQKHGDNMIEGKDYFQLSKDEYRPFGDNPNYNYPRGGFLLTESGVKKVTKKEKKNALESYFGKGKTTALSQAPTPIIKTQSPVDTKQIEALQSAPLIMTPMAPMENEMESKMFSLFESFVTYHQKAMEEERKANEDLRNMLRDTMQFMMQQQILQSTPVVENDELSDSPDETQKYKDFKKEITKAIDLILALPNCSYTSRSDILCQAYKKLQSKYGICWDQEKKDYYNAFGVSPVSTLELVYYIEQKPHHRNLLLCVLNTMYSENKAK